MERTSRPLGLLLRRWAAAYSAVVLSALFAFANPVSAKPHEARVPLHQGTADVQELSAALCKELGVKPVPVPSGRLSLDGLKGSNFVAAVNESLGDGCRVTITPDALVLSVDPDKLPKDCEAVSRAVRVFTAVEYPEATEAQRKLHGLHLPEQIDAIRPLVVLVHGLDGDRNMWNQLIRLLNASGHQVACFTYPSDGPVGESAAMLARHVAALRQRYPSVRVDFVCHSMGGLVARAFVEGPAYPGNVGHLILCGTPNTGSNWSRYRLALEAQEHYHLWKNEPTWSPTWMITDGLGEAGRDLRPGSAFLARLNANPRRDGVRYTIVAGNQSPVRSTCADWWECSARTLVPNRVSGWWGFRHSKDYMMGKAAALRVTTGDSDGPVLVESTKLAGVGDWVVVNADHASLCWGETPAAWAVIRDRLGK